MGAEKALRRSWRSLFAQIEAQQGLRIQSRWIKAGTADSDLGFICTEAVDGRMMVVSKDLSVRWRDAATLQEK